VASVLVDKHGTSGSTAFGATVLSLNGRDVVFLATRRARSSKGP